MSEQEVIEEYGREEETPGTFRSKFFILTIILLLLSAIGAYLWYTSTPQYSLNKIVEAYSEHNLVMFEKYVDIDGASKKFINDLSGVLMRQMKEDNSDGAKLAGVIGAGALQLFQPRLVDNLRITIERLIERYNTEVLKKDSDFPESVQSLLKSKDLQLVSIKQQGNIAYLNLTLLPEGALSPLKLQILMRDMGWHWQVAEIMNTNEIVSKLIRQKDEEAQKKNDAIRNKIKQYIEIYSAKAVVKDENRYTKKLYIAVNGKNKWNQPVSDVKYIARITVEGGSTSKYNLHSDVVNPGAIDGLWSVSLNEFIPADRNIIKAKSNELSVEVIPYSLKPLNKPALSFELK